MSIFCCCRKPQDNVPEAQMPVQGPQVVVGQGVDVQVNRCAEEAMQSASTTDRSSSPSLKERVQEMGSSEGNSVSSGPDSVGAPRDAAETAVQDVEFLEGESNVAAEEAPQSTNNRGLPPQVLAELKGVLAELRQSHPELG